MLKSLKEHLGDMGNQSPVQNQHLSSQFMTQANIGKRDSTNMPFTVQPNQILKTHHSMNKTQSHTDLQQIIKTALTQCESATNLSNLSLHRGSASIANKKHLQSLKKISNLDMPLQMIQERQINERSPTSGLISLKDARNERKMSKNRQVEQTILGTSMERNSNNNSTLLVRPTRSESLHLQDFKSLRDQIKMRKQNSSLSQNRCAENTMQENKNEADDKLHQVINFVNFRTEQRSLLDHTPQNQNKIIYAFRHSSNRQSGVEGTQKRVEDQSPGNITSNMISDSNFVSIRNSFLTNDPLQARSQGNLFYGFNGFNGFNEKLETLRLTNQQIQSVDDKSPVLDLQKKISTNLELFQIDEEGKFNGRKQASNYQTLKPQSHQGSSLKKITHKILQGSSKQLQTKIDKPQQSVDKNQLITPRKFEKQALSPQVSQFTLQSKVQDINDIKQKKLHRQVSLLQPLTDSLKTTKRTYSQNKLDQLIQKFGCKTRESKSPNVFHTLDQSSTSFKQALISNNRGQKTMRNYESSMGNAKGLMQTSPRIKESLLVKKQINLDQNDSKSKSRNYNDVKPLMSKPAKVTISINGAIDELYNTIDNIQSKKSLSSTGKLTVDSFSIRDKSKNQSQSKRKNLVKKFLVNNLSQYNLGNQTSNMKSFDNFNQSPFTQEKLNIFKSLQKLQDQTKENSQNKRLSLNHNKSTKNIVNSSMHNRSLDNFQKQLEKSGNRNKFNIQIPLSLAAVKNQITMDSKDQKIKDKNRYQNIIKSPDVNHQKQLSAFNGQSMPQQMSSTSKIVSNKKKQSNYDLPRQQNSQSSTKLAFQNLTNLKVNQSSNQSLFNTTQKFGKAPSLQKPKQDLGSPYSVMLSNSPSTKNVLQQIVDQVHEKKPNTTKREVKSKENQNIIFDLKKQTTKPKVEQSMNETKIKSLSIDNPEEIQNVKSSLEVKHITLIKGNTLYDTQCLKSERTLNTSSSMSLLTGLQTLMPSKKLNQINQIISGHQQFKSKHNSNYKENQILSQQINPTSTRKRWTQKMAEKIQKQVEERQKVLGMTTDKINIIEKPKLIESAVQKPDKPQHMYSKSNPKLLLQLSNMSNLQSATPDSSQFFYENQNSSYHPNGDSRLGVNISNDFTIKITDDSLASACMNGKHSRLLTTRKQLLQCSQSLKKKAKARNSVMGEIENILFEGNIKSTKKIVNLE
eukprot:403333318